MGKLTVCACVCVCACVRISVASMNMCVLIQLADTICERLLHRRADQQLHENVLRVGKPKKSLALKSIHLGFRFDL